MWVNELQVENIRCFGSIKIDLISKRQIGNGGLPFYPLYDENPQDPKTSSTRVGEPHRWVTLLGENGAGKSTLLQSLALLLVGPEGAPQLLPRPLGWLRDEGQLGKISIRIHQGDNDPGRHGKTKVSREFGYTFIVTGPQKLSYRNKAYTEPAIVESPDTRLSWLRENALTSKGRGWFAAGYGAFRRLTRSSQIIVPSLEPQIRSTNFRTQFDEHQALSTFERWMVYLDYRIAKREEVTEAKRQRDLGVAAINKVLPDGVTFDSVSSDGRIYFRTAGRKVPTIGLSDGYRSVLALIGDLTWRLIQAFPDSDNPLLEEGVVLIDELDIHLHPRWQRSIAGWLRQQLPNIQFIVGTHSPLIAAGAGEDALTLLLEVRDGVVEHRILDGLSVRNVDRNLREAFGTEPYSPVTQSKIDKYDELTKKGARRNRQEEQQRQQLELFMQAARPIGGPPEPGSLDARIEKFLDDKLP
jgi:predicted ATPase